MLSATSIIAEFRTNFYRNTSQNFARELCFGMKHKSKKYCLQVRHHFYRISGI